MAVINIILPIVLLLCGGFTIRNYWIKDQIFWNSLDKLTYNIFFPALIIKIVSSGVFKDIDYSFVFLLLFTISGILVILLLLKKIFFVDSKFFTSFVQGCIRYNSYIFINIIDLLLGESAMPIVALLTVSMIIATNFISIVVLDLYSTKKKKFIKIISSVLLNPLVMASILGLILNIFNIELLNFLDITIIKLGEVSLVLSIISVGSCLNFNSDSKKYIKLILICCGIKLILLPIIIYNILSYFSFSESLNAICVIFAGMPCATNSYILSKNMNGDYKSMSQIVTLQTILSIPTLGVIISFYSDIIKNNILI